jgi:uncharacterized protein YjbI with pentapeptide repeats
MTEAAPLIGGRELIRRILAGERDFSGTRLRPEEANLAALEGYQELLAYLQTQDLRAAPLVAERVDWRFLSAPGLVCQAARLAGADLSGAVLRGADLRRADLTGACLRDADLTHALLTHQRLQEADLSGARLAGADLYEANLTGAVLRNADLTGARVIRLTLQGADLTGARLTNVDFYRADLRGVVGLEAAHDLATVRLYQTIVTPRERELIEAAFRAQPWFDVREA